MSKRARLIIGIILMVLGVLSLMGLYLQTGMNLWTAFGVGLGASIFTIGLPCLGTFLIWGYKEKEKVENKEDVEKKEIAVKKKFKLSNKAKRNILIGILVFIQVCLLIIIIALIITCFFYTNNTYLKTNIVYLIIPMVISLIFIIVIVFIEKKIFKKFA